MKEKKKEKEGRKFDWRRRRRKYMNEEILDERK